MDDIKVNSSTKALSSLTLNMKPLKLLLNISTDFKTNSLKSSNSLKSKLNTKDVQCFRISQYNQDVNLLIY